MQREEDRPTQLSWRETVHRYLPFVLKLNGGSIFLMGIIRFDLLPSVMGGILVLSGFWLRERWPDPRY